MLLVFLTPRQALSSQPCQQMVWLYWLQDRDNMPNWYTILQHCTHTMKPRDPLLLADGTLRCGMYPAGKVVISQHPSIFRLKWPWFAFSSIFSWLYIVFWESATHFDVWGTTFSNLIASWLGPKFNVKVNLSSDKNWSKHIYVHCRLDFKRREGIKVMPQCSTLCVKHKHCIYQSGS